MCDGGFVSNLFRKEVFDRHSQRHLGDVFLSTPLSYWAITGLIALIMAILVVVVVFGEYARKERVVGVLIPSKGLVQIIPQQTGVFEEIFVSAGDYVDRGTPLLKINNDTALSDGSSISEALLTEMETEQANLLSQMQVTQDQYRLAKARLEIQKAGLVSEAERALAQIQIQSRSVELEGDILNRIRDLFEEEAASTLEVTTQESRYLTARQALGNLKNTRQKILTQIKDVESQIAMLPLEQVKEKSEIKNRISTLEQNVIRADAQSSLIIRSPVKGRVTVIIARKGQAAIAKPVMSILPEGGELQVELFVPTRAAGFVKPGQSVRLLYNAFPYQKFGFFDGEIKQVSKSVINTSDFTNVPQLPEPVFLVTVTIDKQFVDTEGEQFPLQAGMTLSADLILEDRKIWEWVFEPLLGTIR
jgi:membrane fusion protein